MVDEEKFWKCPNCGQVHFSDHPPDMCAVCQDFTTWQLLPGKPNADPNPRDSDGSPPDESDGDSPTLQLPLLDD